MQRFLYILCVSLVLGVFAIPAAAQDKAKDAKKAQPQKTEKPAPKQGDNTVQDSIDLDSFFKKGEENAKNGASCNKPAKPADPIA